MTVTDPFSATASSPSLNFPEIGDVHTIIVRKVDERDDTDPAGNVKTWDDGRPKKVFIFNGEDEQGNPVALWVRGNMVKAIRNAQTESGLTSVIDTKLTVKFYAEGEPPKKGFKAPKLFKAKIEKAAPPAATTADPFSDDDNDSF